MSSDKIKPNESKVSPYMQETTFKPLSPEEVKRRRVQLAGNPGKPLEIIKQERLLQKAAHTTDLFIHPPKSGKMPPPTLLTIILIGDRRLLALSTQSTY